jgi:hypothetical protein
MSGERIVSRETLFRTAAENINRIETSINRENPILTDLYNVIDYLTYSLDELGLEEALGIAREVQQVVEGLFGISNALTNLRYAQRSLHHRPDLEGPVLSVSQTISTEIKNILDSEVIPKIAQVRTALEAAQAAQNSEGES